MKKLLLLLALLLFATPVWAGPFVTCNTYPPGDVTKFSVTYDGVTTDVPYIEAVFDGQMKAVLKDLVGIPTGAHDIKASACNIWGCSDNSVPLEFIKQLPGVPSGLGLEE